MKVTLKSLLLLKVICKKVMSGLSLIPKCKVNAELPQTEKATPITISTPLKIGSRVLNKKDPKSRAYANGKSLCCELFRGTNHWKLAQSKSNGSFVEFKRKCLRLYTSHISSKYDKFVGIQTVYQKRHLPIHVVQECRLLWQGHFVEAERTAERAPQTKSR